ncbi:hypothetical protein EHS25_009341 [Saitozyma podzolica]|uniref:Phospholipid/glycerol acyltransferase domain-containing protein n=1 Tax=Saitozyma podzolica TaxID=1890683 RepID=A0A427YLP2_9TREE|nr:hypothetical protein EHS25_009341 [Saitozyma podzolica]
MSPSPIFAPDGRPMYTIPIADRPPHGPLSTKIFFPLFFNLAQLGINSAQFASLPLLLIPFVGRRLYDAAIDWTKDGYGRLLILITVLFGPTSLVLTTDTPPDLADLVERDDHGNMTRINLPDRLVIMSNHQAYTDWMYMWILACYAGHARGLTILLKASLKNIPVVGWGMIFNDNLTTAQQFFRFIFLNRSWAADRSNLTRSLTRLGRNARSSDEAAPNTLVDGIGKPPNGSGADTDGDEAASLLSRAKEGRMPLWLLIFPEGTITSDEERSKSVRYANREGIPDFVTMLHPRSTGLLFCLRTLLPQIPDMQLLDVTIGYPGVPYGKYPQEWYGLGSIFFRSVPPPTVHIHLHLYTDLSSPSSPIPSLRTPQLAHPSQARAFELWLRGVWTEKEKRLSRFMKTDQRFVGDGGEQAREVVPIRQVLKWSTQYDLRDGKG